MKTQLKKKVLFLCLDMDASDILGDIHTGAGHLYVSESLSVLKEHNVETLVITRHNCPTKPEKEVFGSVTIRRIQIGFIDKQPKEFLWERQQESITKVFDVLKELDFKPTVIHAFYWYSGVAALSVKDKYPKAKILYSIISLGKIKHKWQGYLSTHDESREYWEKKIFDESQLILSVSEQENENTQSLYGINPEQVFTIGRGIDTNLFKPSYNSFGQKAFIFVGRLVKSKGYVWLLKLYEQLLNDGDPNLPPLWIFGGEKKEVQLAQQESLQTDVLREAYNQGKICWWGKIPRIQLPSFYTKSILTFLPSYYEPGARIILESMACGVPVIMTPTGYSNELVQDGINGYVAPFDDIDAWKSRINSYLSDFETRVIMSKKAYESFSIRFTMSKFKERHWSVYEKLIFE